MKRLALVLLFAVCVAGAVLNDHLAKFDQTLGWMLFIGAAIALWQVAFDRSE